jgi:hypothetical protein
METSELRGLQELFRCSLRVEIQEQDELIDNETERKGKRNSRGYHREYSPPPVTHKSETEFMQFSVAEPADMVRE